MFEKTPEQLFKKVRKYCAKQDADKKWTNDNCVNAIKKCDEILDILREKGDESKPSIEGGEGTGARPTTFDNLTQKTFYLQGYLIQKLGVAFLLQDNHAWSSYFKMAVKYFDKAIQINPENTDMWMIKLEHFNKWLELKKEEDGEEHPELWVEIIKCCDKVLSIDKDHLDAWDNKRWATGELERWEDEIECNNNVLRLDNRKENRIVALGKNSECFKNLGRLSEAEKSLLEIQKIDPYNEMALEGLQKLSLDKVQQQLGKVKKTVEQIREAVDGRNQIPNDIEIKKINSSSLETSMSCKKCGSTLKPTAKFCGKCGTPIAYNVQI